jgi:hypothetical protein
MFLTRGGSVQRSLSSGPSGWPADQTPWSVGPTLQLLASRHHGDTLQEAVTGNLKPKVGGGRTPCLLGHMALLVGHHLPSYRHNQVGNHSLDPYKYPLPVDINTPLCL